MIRLDFRLRSKDTVEIFLVPFHQSLFSLEKMNIFWKTYLYLIPKVTYTYVLEDGSIQIPFWKYSCTHHISKVVHLFQYCAHVWYENVNFHFEWMTSDKIHIYKVFLQYVFVNASPKSSSDWRSSCKICTKRRIL